jgi:hypothetical protein
MKKHVNPLSIQAHNCIMLNIMAYLGGVISGGNQPSPPPLNP